MRTTVTLDDDVSSAVEKLRRTEHIGVSEAINRLARLGLRTEPTRKTPFRTQTFPLGMKIDVSSIADALEEMDGPDFT